MDYHWKDSISGARNLVWKSPNMTTCSQNKQREMASEIILFIAVKCKGMIWGSRR
jgi:hypothetical protein